MIKKVYFFIVLPILMALSSYNPVSAGIRGEEQTPRHDNLYLFITEMESRLIEGVDVSISDMVQKFATECFPPSFHELQGEKNSFFSLIAIYMRKRGDKPEIVQREIKRLKDLFEEALWEIDQDYINSTTMRADSITWLIDIHKLIFNQFSDDMRIHRFRFSVPLVGCSDLLTCAYANNQLPTSKLFFHYSDVDCISAKEKEEIVQSLRAVCYQLPSLTGTLQAALKMNPIPPKLIQRLHQQFRTSRNQWEYGQLAFSFVWNSQQMAVYLFSALCKEERLDKSPESFFWRFCNGDPVGIVNEINARLLAKGLALIPIDWIAFSDK